MEYQTLRELSMPILIPINENKYPNVQWNELKLDRNDKNQ